jgi:hypothetical protein
VSQLGFTFIAKSKRYTRVSPCHTVTTRSFLTQSVTVSHTTSSHSNSRFDRAWPIISYRIHQKQMLNTRHCYYPFQFIYPSTDTQHRFQLDASIPVLMAHACTTEKRSLFHPSRPLPLLFGVNLDMCSSGGRVSRAPDRRALPDPSFLCRQGMTADRLP